MGVTQCTIRIFRWFAVQCKWILDNFSLYLVENYDSQRYYRTRASVCSIKELTLTVHTQYFIVSCMEVFEEHKPLPTFFYFKSIAINFIILKPRVTLKKFFRQNFVVKFSVSCSLASRQTNRNENVTFFIRRG